MARKRTTGDRETAASAAGFFVRLNIEPSIKGAAAVILLPVGTVDELM
jgi:hypothetical protein